VLIDGRNRLAACELAGVEPRWQLLGEQDAAALIPCAGRGGSGRYQTTGRRYIRVARTFGDRTSIMLVQSRIDFSAMHLLSSFSMPEEVVDGAVERANDGEHITLADMCWLATRCGHHNPRCGTSPRRP